MVRISSLLFGAFASLALTAPVTENPAFEALPIEKRTSITGTNGGYYYQFYDSGSGGQYSNGNGGTYTVSWDGSDDIVAGKGWSTGAARSITFSATASGSHYLSVYGWFTNPLVEYYIVESWSGYNPSTGLTYKGAFTSDGSTYNVYEGTRTNQPSIEGTSTFNQYWSIRQSQRTSSTVTTANHFAEWQKLGLPLGTFNYQIVATEAFSGSGSATVTVS